MFSFQLRGCQSQVEKECTILMMELQSGSQPSSVVKRVMERLDAFFGETTAMLASNAVHAALKKDTYPGME